MNPDHVDFAEWEAAYVLGALSPTDRRVFEAHVAECPLCRDAIADIAPLTGLLARVAPERAASLADDEPGDHPPDVAARARLVESGVSEARRRRRARWAGGLAAAALVVVAVVLAVVAITSAVRGRDVVALDPVVDVPVTASVGLTDVAWGTRLELECSYERTSTEESDVWTYALYVTSVDGTSREVSSWRAYAGATARLTAGTALEADDIAAIEIRSEDGGTVLMRKDFRSSDGPGAP